MRIRIISGMLICYTGISAQPNISDTLKSVTLDEVMVRDNYSLAKNKLETQHLEIVGADFLNRHWQKVQQLRYVLLQVQAG